MVVGVPGRQGDREIVTAEEFAVTQMQLEALAAEPTLRELLATGYSECSIFWVDKDTGVYCKARPDHVHPIDARSVTAAGPQEHGRRVAGRFRPRRRAPGLPPPGRALHRGLQGRPPG
jgi:hypothetical protein